MSKWTTIKVKSATVKRLEACYEEYCDICTSMNNMPISFDEYSEQIFKIGVNGEEIDLILTDDMVVNKEGAD